jgi:hypothetical protein
METEFATTLTGGTCTLKVSVSGLTEGLAADLQDLLEPFIDEFITAAEEEK